MKVTCTNLVLVRIGKKFNNDNRIRDMVVGKVASHLCVTLIIEGLKFSVEHSMVVTTLILIKHQI